MTTLDGNDYWVPPEPIQIVIGSQADDVIGQPIYFAFFDEISFIRNQDIDKQKEKAKNMIDTAIGGMFTRFIHNGKNPTLLVVASSKRSEQSFMEQYIKLLSATTGEKTYVVDKPVWEVKPKGTYSDITFKVGLGNKYLASIIIYDEDNLDYYRQKGYRVIDVPEDFKSKFEQDIERGLCDFAGISSSSLSKYMSGEIVADCIHEDIINPFPDIIESSNAKDDKSQYKQFFNLEAIPSEMLGLPMFIHLDMSKSGGSGKNDNSGLAGVWITGKKPSTNEDDQSGDLNFRLAFATSIRAPKGRQISFEKNRNFIRWLREIGFNIVGVSYDTYQSVDTGQQLESEGFNCKVISVDRVDKDGVCLLGDTLIKTPNGDKRIDEILPGEQIYAFDDKIKQEVVTTFDTWMHTKNVDEYYEIETTDGRLIKCTNNHLILTTRGYVRADELLETDEIICVDSDAKLDE